jgi:nucleotide-binding universal stress UspA family protein
VSNAIFIPYDSSDGAKAAVEAAGGLFPGRHAEIVCVWHSLGEAAPAATIAMPADVVGEALEELDRHAKGEAELVAEEGAGRARAAGLEATGRAVKASGNVWATLVHLGEEEQAAALVLGSRGHSGLKSLLLGSVSTGVVHHATVPVVVVSPDAGAPRGNSPA